MLKRSWILFFLFCWLCPVGAQPQTSCAGEVIYLKPAKTSLQGWLTWLEQEQNVTLAYNTSQLNLNEQISIKEPDTLTVAQFLSRLMPACKVNVQEQPGRKLLLQIDARRSYQLEGSIREEETGEKLNDAFVVFLETSTGKNYTALTEDGKFSLNMLEGTYRMRIHYMGYHPIQKDITLNQNQLLDLRMKPLSIELQETTVRPEIPPMELDESLPTNKLTFTNANLFSQMSILPGVIGSPMGIHFQVNGGGDDENLLLVDGVPLYHYGHMNSMMSPFNGDAIKNVTFHRSFFPTQFEGRLSSVTEVEMKEGNKQEHMRTLSLDMPAVAGTLEGPLIKNKLSYIVGGRRSWLDFFDELVNEDKRMNHSYNDWHAKLAWDISARQSLQALVYQANDRFYYPNEQNENETLMKWNNQIYQLGYNTLFGKHFSFSSALAYTYYTNRAQMVDADFENMQFLKSGIRSMSLMASFNYQQDPVFHASWGMRLSREIYEMAVFGDTLMNRNEPVNQLSLFYDNRIRISPRLSAQVGVNFVFYAPDKHRKYESIQPRFMLRYSLGNKDLLYGSASRMEQFYHYICIDNFALPTDFRMPSIGGFQPRTSEHYEVGWKHFLSKGYWEVSSFFKTRRNVLALRPDVFPEDDQWKHYIMSGKGHSYGAKVYFTQRWKKWSVQASYAYIRSKEKFTELKDMGTLPSPYDIPHSFATAVSFQFTKHSSVSVGGEVRSGRVKDFSDDWDFDSEIQFRGFREPTMYRLDAGYGYQRAFKKILLVLRAGLYSIVGNPPDEEIQDFYFVNYHRNCLPYATISFKF